jgi:DNA adenine methylase
MSGARLFRWLGTKAHLVPVLAPWLRARLDASGGRLVSLFYGGGALEQAIAGAGVQLVAEANPDLLTLYAQLAHGPRAVFAELRALDARVPRTRAGFLELRATHPLSLSPITRAARFLWLSGMSFNGVWRVNRSGAHNVPPDIARLRRPWPLPTLAALETVAEHLSRTEFHADWRDAAAKARRGDLVLADPPYLGGFDEYTASGFPLDEHRSLARVLQQLAHSGVSVVAFNSPAARDLYAWAELTTACRLGRVNCRGDRRGRVDEMLAIAGLQSSINVAA